MSLIEYPAARLSAPTTRRRALYPMMHPEPVLVPVVDTNALLVMGCDMVVNGKQEDLLSGLAGTGRATPYIAAHVPAEIDRHLPRLARRYQVPESEVRRLLDEVVLPSARLVELEIRDHLAPGAKQIMHVDRDLPKQWWGDPDDVPTMALAEFLAPAVIITQDSVFARFGFATTEWIRIAKDLLRMAGFEADFVDAAVVTEFALRLAATFASELIAAVRRHPVLATAIVAAAVWICQRLGYLRSETWARYAARVWELAQPLVKKAGTAALEQTRIRNALIVVEPPSGPVLEQIAARYLARCSDSLTPAELRDALAVHGHKIPATHLKRAMNTHCGFVREPGDHYTVGHPGSLSSRSTPSS
ncbi:PIN domain-containing protein [Streptomyces mirabilis]|uniref:PIN domain-containing protein n=1 Tax=Streptomyces mirabilis TaxID=68239 RepID=UPI0033BE6C82